MEILKICELVKKLLGADTHTHTHMIHQKHILG